MLSVKSFHWKHRRKSLTVVTSLIRHVLKLESDQFEAIAIYHLVFIDQLRGSFSTALQENGSFRRGRSEWGAGDLEDWGIVTCQAGPWTAWEISRGWLIYCHEGIPIPKVFVVKNLNLIFPSFFISSSVKLQTYAPKDGKMGIKADIHLWIGKTSSQVRRSRNSFLKNENQQ